MGPVSFREPKFSLAETDKHILLLFINNTGIVFIDKTGYLVLLFPVKRVFFGLKFYMIVKNFSFGKWVKTIFRNFQSLAGFCNAKVDKHIADIV